ncbi:nitrilase-related carbon-nitrogen hydrolase [Trichlorobacter lovleyi]|uniref:Nitrilase/cyanide hydratase and apolipoprotein N-acyltransferase n=1 Tax=Trichlorobacter lovleyi (strain ATCC BAA-1151 / DSM 17278 / SZ) TaxID=398767 RepID=B3E4K9_TRIL1|nr:nitrilase-related carbon-nitrogen hydrolase [Trichlorobacter lovleyi]ACD95945.1 Nitrilase/cyanide hydratase and apolipoprotein N-acyltransferase [Trichlorobacter lovleyi SZ]
MDFSVALLQIKPKLGRVADNLALIQEQVEQAIAQKADLAVLPELALTGYFLKDLVPEVALPLDSPEIAILKELSQRISIAVGFVEVTADFQFYNSAAWFEDGELKHLHRKVYLPTYGLFDEQRYLGRGDRFRAFDTKFGRVGLLVCEDMWHLSAPYLLAMDGATTLVCLSSSPGRGVDEQTLGTATAWRNLTTSTARFLTCRVVYVNRVGYEDGVGFWGGSHLVAPSGEVVAAAPEFEPAILQVSLTDAELRRERISSPLVRDENLCITLRELSRIDQERSC